MLNFSNKDLGAKCWGESLLAQRGCLREVTKLTFPKGWSFLTPKTLKLKVLHFYFLCIFPSIFLTSSYSLCFFPHVHSIN